MTPQLRINTSEHATPGYIVATLRGQIVWMGLGKDFGQVPNFDALHIHPSDAATIRAVAARKNFDVKEVA